MTSITVTRAEDIARVLGGRKSGSGFIACCPAHDDHRPSLSITEAEGGMVLIHCHAGCDQAEVISHLRSSGLWPQKVTGRCQPHTLPTQTKKSERNRDDGKRSEAALSIWQISAQSVGTLVETYLGSRGLHLRPTPTLRFHASLKHTSSSSWPAMIAMVTHDSDDRPLAIHRTFLAHDGEGKAPVEPPKMMLGPCSGGAVRLADADNVLMVGEGIETCLSAMQLFGKPAWAALSTSGLRNLILPDRVQEVIVLADGDAPGEAAALHAAKRWKKEGRRVLIKRAPKGLDFNDVLVGRLAAQQSDAT